VSRTRFIGLLRGINVGGHNKIPMAELRALCTEIGWDEVRTYIQSGNIVFAANGSTKSLENALEQSIERRFGLRISVVVRRANDWSAYVERNPFPDAARKEPKLLALGLAKVTPNSSALNDLQERAANGEQLAQTRDVLWIHFPNGIARSKLTPDLMARLVGSPVTLRNWRTVLKLKELYES